LLTTENFASIYRTPDNSKTKKFLDKRLDQVQRNTSDAFANVSKMEREENEELKSQEVAEK